MKKKRIIRVSTANLEKLRETGRYDQYGRPIRVSKSMVYNALAGRTDSEEAERIRREAMELYGGVVETKTIF